MTCWCGRASAAVLVLLLVTVVVPHASVRASILQARRRNSGSREPFFGEQYDLTNSDGSSSKSSGEIWLGHSGIGTQPFDEVERIPPHLLPANASLGRRAPTPASPSWRTYLGNGDEREDQQSVIPADTPTPAPTANIDEVFCDFGPLPVASLCEWQDGCGALTWTPGTGLGANWLGGPQVDSTSGTQEGGYGFLETSHVPTKTSITSDSVGPNGLLHSPQLGSTGTSGTCFTFKFAIDGLSAAGLRASLHAGFDEFSSTFTRVNDSRPSTITCNRPPVPVTSTPAPLEERVLWHAHYHTLGVWQTAQILYTFPDIHTLIIEGIPVEASDTSRSYRGYVAIDDVDLQPGSSCIGFCNFASGFCDWANDLDDDFDWGISRGSSNPTTGPVADRDATLSSGGYAFIDSSYPRRPGDLARLISVSFPSSANDMPQCMHFSFHMFGSGVGELRIALRHARTLEATLQEIWRLKGNAGNSWFDSRVTISSLDDFQIVFEATVGNTGMGDIAIDDISFTNGPCPTSPQVAAPTTFPRDCTFEIDECEWVNSREPSSTALSTSQAALPSRGRVDWERVSQSTLNPRNQRKPYTLPSTRPRQEYFMALQTKGITPPVTASASLVGAPIKPVSGEAICLTFWYLMFESFIDNTGPSLGVLRVLIQPVSEPLDAATPIWQLYNNQGPTWYYGQVGISEKREFSIVFEGTWGPNRANGNIAIDDVAFYTGNCTIRPSSASVRSEDCSFEKGLCGWENVTSSGVNDPRMQWQRAFTNHRPAQLLDKTFGSTGDFVFFDIFSPTQRREVRLRSPVIRPSSLDEDAVCFTFWFVAFGVEENTSLKIIKAAAKDDAEGSREGSDDDEDREQVLWSLIAKGYNNLRPSWTWAQVTIEPRAAYRIILEGSGSNGGFAIDDIKFQPNLCSIRPAAAKPSTITTEF